MMTEQDIQRLENIAIRKLERGVTYEEALQSLQRAGILDKDGNHTEPYKNLGKAVKTIEK